MIQKIKGKIYALIFWQTRVGEIFNMVYGLRIFYKYTFTEEKLKSRESFQAFLTKQYHIVEKGLALPDPRQGFGKPKIRLLISKSLEYEKNWGSDRTIANIKETLQQYLDRNLNLKNEDLPFYELVSNFLHDVKIQNTGGVKKLNLVALQKATDIDFESFVKTRTSVRDFSELDVPFSEIEKAVELARFAPSVCNRQSWRLHHYTDKALKNKLLKLQGGNNGFTDSINQLLIVTTDVRRFTKLEGNQVFVDGGLFAMNLLLSLHAQGIGSCCLNTCVPYVVENQIKDLGSIPHSERLIMMIGIGKLKDNFEVAISDRIGVAEILESNN